MPETLYERVKRVSEEEGQKKYTDWTLHNSSEPTDYSLWKKAIESIDPENDKAIKKCIDSIGE